MAGQMVSQGKMGEAEKAPVPSDHAAVAAYFNRLADRYTADAKMHDPMAAVYRTGRTAGMGDHCERLVRDAPRGCQTRPGTRGAAHPAVNAMSAAGPKKTGTMTFTRGMEYGQGGHRDRVMLEVVRKFPQRWRSFHALDWCEPRSHQRQTCQMCTHRWQRSCEPPYSNDQELDHPTRAVDGTGAKRRGCLQRSLCVRLRHDRATLPRRGCGRSRPAAPRHG